MKQDLHKIFKNIQEIEPPKDLAGSILARVDALQKRQIKRRLMLSYLSLAGSFGAFVLAIVEYGQSFLQSDFWILLRLLLTDASAVFKNWNDFLFSLLETFPVISVVAILIPVFLIFISFSVYFKFSYKNNYNLNLT